MDIEEFSDILSEPIFNELSDNILNDIDIHELDNFELFHEEFTNCNESTTQDVKDEPMSAFAKSKSDVHPACHTLEALLRSANPLSRVPPAPELHSDTVICLKKDQSANGNRLFHDSPLGLSQSAPLVCNQNVKNSGTEQGKSKLIFQHLQNCPTSHWNSSDAASETTSRRKLSNNVYSERKSSEERQKDADPDNGVSNVRKAPHNAIEKRYRASINGRIDELRKLLSPYRSYDEKLNKSAVLRKAIECIRNLEEDNRTLRSELAGLQLAAKGQRNGERTISSKTSPDSGTSSMERSPCTRSLTCQSNLSSSESGSFTSSPMLERHSWSQNAHGNRSGHEVATDGLTHLDTPTTSMCWLMSAGQEQSPSRENIAYGVPQGVFEMDQPMVLNASTVGLSSADCLLNGYDCESPAANPPFELSAFTLEERLGGGNGMLPLVGQCNGYLETIEQRAGNIFSASDYSDSVPIPVGELHVKRNGADWVAGETGPTPSKMRRQLVTSSDEGEHLPASHSTVANSYNFAGTQPAVDFSRPEERQVSGCTDAVGSNCPTVRQLLMLSTGATMPQPRTPLVYPAPESTVTEESASRFNTGLAARTTLCVTALCLIVLDPVMLLGKGQTPSRPMTGKSDAKSAWSSPARRLLLAGDGLDVVGDSTAAMYNSWCGLALGIAQWSLAILLCLWACVKSQASHKLKPSTSSAYGSTHLPGKQAKRNSSIWHWNNAEAAIRKSAWPVASQHLNCCLTELGQPSLTEPLNGASRPGVTFALGFRCRSLVDLVDCVCLRLPRWLYHFYGRCALPSVGGIHCVQSTDDGSTAVMEADEVAGDVHATDLSLSAVHHRYMELCLLANYSGADFSLPTGIAWRLVFAQVRSLLTESVRVLSAGDSCSPECQTAIDRPGVCCRHQNTARQAVVSRTVALALFLRDCLEQSLLSCLFLRMAIRLARCLPASSVWHCCLLNPGLQTVLRRGRIWGNSHRPGRICECVANSKPEGGLSAYLLPDLRTQLSQACCHTIFFGSAATVRDLEDDMATLTSLCRFSSRTVCDDQLCRNSDTSLWWSNLVHFLWRYHRLILQGRRCPAATADPRHVDRTVSHPIDTAKPPLAPPLRPPPASALSEQAGDNDLTRALWLAYCCLLKSLDVEVPSLAESACGLLTASLVDVFETAVGTDSQLKSRALDKVAWHFLCADWTLSGLTHWLRNAQTLKPHSSRVQWNNSFLKALDVLRMAADHLQSLLSESGISSSLPRWMSSTMSHHEAIGHIIRGANPVVVRLSLLHNRRSRSREDVAQLQVPPEYPLPHYPISLSGSGGIDSKASQPTPESPTGNEATTYGTGTAPPLPVKQHIIAESIDCTEHNRPQVIQSPGQ